MFIEIWDDTDKELLVNSVLASIRELADLRDRAEAWGCGSMVIRDRIDRLQRILREISEAE